MKDEIVNVGIVGCGDISRVHVGALLETGKCRLSGACDINRDKALKLANEYKIPKVYTDFSKMLKEEKLDLVHVITPPQVHARLSIEAMEAGCHVLVEKPMCMTVQEADQMIKVAKRNKVKLCVVHSFLFNPAIRKALTNVKQGEVGDLLWVDTLISMKSLLRWKDWPTFPEWYSNLPGGVFGEIIAHGLYVQLAFLGNVRKIIGITKECEETSKLTPFSELQVLMDCENAMGNLYMSTRMESTYTILMVRVIGSRKILFANVPSGSVFDIKLETLTNPFSTNIFARALMNIEPALQLLLGSASLATKTLLGSMKRHMTHKAIIEGFIQSIQTGSEPPVTPEEGREVVKATNLIWDNIIT